MTAGKHVAQTTSHTDTQDGSADEVPLLPQKRRD